MNPRFRSRIFRPALCALALAIAVQVAADTDAASRSYDIPAGPLGRNLSTAATQGGIPLSFDPALTKGLQSPALSGDYTPRQALEILLAGSSLELMRKDDGSYTLQKRDGEATLPAVRVSGTALGVVSEGSGSYSAEAVSIAKGARSPREIPQSVSVLTRQRIDDQNLTTVADALNRVTGVRTQSYESNEMIMIRGYTAMGQFDGVPTGFTLSGDTFFQDMAVLDRIEVMRGPSGLLTGSGNPGGTVNFVRKRARDAFALSGGIESGSWDHHRFDLDVTGPLNESGSLRGRAVTAFEDEQKYYDKGESQDQLAYGNLEYDLGSRTTLGVIGSYRTRDYVYFSGLAVNDDGSLPARDSFCTNYCGDGSSPEHLRQIELSADLTHRFVNDWEAKLTYNDSDIERKNYAGNPHLYHFRSYDAYLSGPVRVFNRDHTFIVGYNHAKYDRHNFGVLAGDVPYQSTNGYEQSGIYGSARIKLLEALTLSIGGRWSDYKNPGNHTQRGGDSWSTTLAPYDVNEFTPYGGIVWDFSEQLTFYASYTDSFVSQTQTDYSGAMLEPKVGWQIEAGAKGEFFNGRLGATLAVFRVREKNRAMIDPDHFGCGDLDTSRCYRAAGLTESNGWELEVSGSPLPGWDLSAGYTYNRNEILRDSNIDNIGNPFSTNTPRHLFNLWSQYRPTDSTTLWGRTAWGVGMLAQSDSYLGNIQQGGYATFSAKVGYRLDSHWDISLFVNNLFDRTYLQTVGYAQFFNIYGEPRNFTLALRGRW
ncbi:MAG: TonB-dependent siderophore receptor [Porticoccaceae bacterium]